MTVGRSGGMPGAYTLKRKASLHRSVSNDKRAGTIVRAKLDTESHATPFRCHRVVASISDVTDAAAETASIALCVFADERYRHPQVVTAPTRMSLWAAKTMSLCLGNTMSYTTSLWVVGCK